MQIITEFQEFVEPEGSLPLHKTPAAAPYPELKKSTLHVHKYFSLLLLIMYSHLTKSLSLRSINEDFVYTFQLSHVF
jgi:hypothetical protein